MKLLHQATGFYAEYSTDFIIRKNYFPEADSQGVFVEVGGAGPTYLSMSRHFLESGWTCVVVEPNPTFADQHREDININGYHGKKIIVQEACAESENLSADFSIVTMPEDTSYSGGVVTDHSFSALYVKEGYFKHLPKNSKIKQIKVRQRRLDSILEELDIKHINILSVDVEGWELEVLRGVDFKKIKVELIVVENWNHDSSYIKACSDWGFRLSRIVAHNYIFINKKPSIQVPWSVRANDYISLSRSRAMVMAGKIKQALFAKLNERGQRN